MVEARSRDSDLSLNMSAEPTASGIATAIGQSRTKSRNAGRIDQLDYLNTTSSEPVISKTFWTNPIIDPVEEALTICLR